MIEIQHAKRLPGAEPKNRKTGESGGNKPTNFQSINLLRFAFIRFILIYYQTVLFNRMS